MKENPGFLESEYAPAPAERAGFYIIPCPFERSVSYGGGAARGPAAILAASQELEAVENILTDEGASIALAPGRAGFHTMAPINCQGPAEAVLARVEAAVEKALAAGAIPVLLGGEHTASLGCLRALSRAAHEKGERLGVIQFDAHADLRSAYKGDRYSHASVMRRVLEELDTPLVQIGAREISPEELEVRERLGLTHYDAVFLARIGLPMKPLPEDFPQKIYISFDVDALDSSLMPATGTPSPGGLTWRDAQYILERCAAGREIAGLDIMELAPIAGLHHADFTAARLAHLIMALAAQAREEK